MKNKKKKLFVFFLFFFFLIGANFVLGAETLPDDPEAFHEFIKYIYNLSLVIGGLLALGILIYGGFRYLLSVGKPAIMTDARDQIFAAILGLIILLSSYLILYTVDPHLVMLRLPGLERIVRPEIKPPEPHERKLPTYFQVPTGMIIENAVLNEEAQEKLDNVYQGAEETAKAAEELYKKSEEIYSLVMDANCGISICGPNCSAIRCTGEDNQAEIEAVIEKTSPFIENLEEKINKATISIDPLANDFSQLEAAGYLKSLGSEVIDYNTFLGIRHGQEVEITAFPDWEDIDIIIEGQTVKDPVTFYLHEKRNEDVIHLARLIYQDTYYAAPEEPPGGWPAPPKGEGQLQWSVVAPRITSHYGMRNHPRTGERHFHRGIDLGPRKGVMSEPIFAAVQGVVTHVGFSGSYGFRIIIEHRELGLSTLYAHLRSFDVKKGDKVAQGEKIGIMGTSGNSTGVHLHFEVRSVAGQPLPPLDYLPPL